MYRFRKIFNPETDFFELLSKFYASIWYTNSFKNNSGGVGSSYLQQVDKKNFLDTCFCFSQIEGTSLTSLSNKS